MQILLGSRIYTEEDGFWSIKGHFDQAVFDNEPVQWNMQGGKLTLSLYMVFLFFMFSFSEKYKADLTL
jgi:hypothetical protein